MGSLTLRLPFWRSGYAYGCAIATAGAIALVVLAPSRRWWWYPVALAVVVALWAACLRQLRSISIHVRENLVEVRDPYWGVHSVPTGDVTSIEAHETVDPMRGQLWYIHTARGQALRLRTVWHREQMAALGRELGVPVCFGGSDCPHRT